MSNEFCISHCGSCDSNCEPVDRYYCDICSNTLPKGEKLYPVSMPMTDEEKHVCKQCANLIVGNGGSYIK